MSPSACDRYVKSQQPIYFFQGSRGLVIQNGSPAFSQHLKSHPSDSRLSCTCLPVRLLSLAVRACLSVILVGLSPPVTACPSVHLSQLITHFIHLSLDLVDALRELVHSLPRVIGVHVGVLGAEMPPLEAVYWSKVTFLPLREPQSTSTTKGEVGGATGVEIYGKLEKGGQLLLGVLRSKTQRPMRAFPSRDRQNSRTRCWRHRGYAPSIVSVSLSTAVRGRKISFSFSV